MNKDEELLKIFFHFDFVFAKTVNTAQTNLKYDMILGYTIQVSLLKDEISSSLISHLLTLVFLPL